MWSPVRTHALLLAGIAGLVATSCMAGTASARPGHIYWGSQGNGSSIGRMDLDGGNPDPTWATGLTCTCLVEFGNGGIWWAAGGTIRRADTTTGEVTTPLPQATATSVNIAAGGILTYSPSATNVGWYSYDTAGGPVAGPLWAGGLSAYTRVEDWAYAMRFTTNPLRFRIVRVRADGSGVEEALRRTYRSTGSAVLASGVTAIAGFAVLILSDIRMLRDFGLVTVIDLGVALFGVLIVLPAVLVLAEPGAHGRLGRGRPRARRRRHRHPRGRQRGHDQHLQHPA